MKNTLYAILGVNDQALPENIAAAYRVHEKRLKHAGDHDSQNELKLIQHAFKILSDPEQRKKYDQKLKADATLSNTVIYYSGDTRHGDYGVSKLVIVSVLAIAGFMVYQHYSRQHAKAVMNNGNRASHAVSLPHPAIKKVSTAPARPDDASRQQSNESPPSQSVTPPDINDVDAVPVPVPATQRRAYVSFLSKPSPRAFVICSSDKRVMTFVGTRNFVDKRLSTLPDDCKPYAVDDSVVWGTTYTAAACGGPDGSCAQQQQSLSISNTGTNVNVAATQDGTSSGNSPLILGQGRGGNYFVDGSVNGHYLNFMVDTGASYVTLPMSFAIAAGLHCNGLATLETGNGQSRACHVVIENLTFGNFKLQYVDALVAPNLAQPLLGMNVLRQFHIEQDGDRMRLTRVY